MFGVSACMLLAGSIVFGGQQERELSGIHGIPVEGHTIVGGIEIIGTKQLDLSHPDGTNPRAAPGKRR